MLAGINPSTLVQTWLGSQFGDPKGRVLLIPESVLMHGHHAPDRIYLTCNAKDGEINHLTFGELERLTRRLGGWLKRQGLGSPTSLVSLAPRNDQLSVLAIIALMRTGTLTLLLNPDDPIQRQQELCSAAGCRVRLTVGEPFSGGELKLPDPRHLPDVDRDWLQPVGPDTPAFLIPTSGSTAASKIVLQLHANAAANANAIASHHRLEAGDRFLGCLPIHHVNGLHFTLFATLSAGSHAILLDGFDPFQYFSQLDLYEPRLVSVVPSVLEALLAMQRGRTLPDKFEYFVSAAAPLQSRTAEQVFTRMRRRVCQGYGLTETTNFACTMPYDISEAAYRRLMIDSDIPSVGIAVAGNHVAIVDSSGDLLPSGQQGEICVRGHNVMAGYWGNEAASAEAFANGWFHTQDIGYAVSDPECGREFFVITGRTKNIAKIGGETVSLEEIERNLRSIAGIKDAAVGAVPDRFYGQKLIAFIVADEILDDGTIRAKFALKMGPTAQPTRLVRLERLPRTPTGKLLRPRLKEMIAELGERD